MHFFFRKGSGHFRVKIYSKPEVPVMELYAAKKPSVFHTELQTLWSMKAFPIDRLRFPRQWTARPSVQRGGVKSSTRYSIANDFGGDGTADSETEKGTEILRGS
jgi:hypothetical protein